MVLVQVEVFQERLMSYIPYIEGKALGVGYHDVGKNLTYMMKFSASGLLY